MPRWVGVALVVVLLATWWLGSLLTDRHDERMKRFLRDD